MLIYSGFRQHNVIFFVYIIKMRLYLCQIPESYIMTKIIKKVLIVASAVVLFVLFATSCQSNERCAAYGETYKYQKQSNY
jgi:hypothetical protein